MNLSSTTTLAIGTAAGSLTVAALVGAATVLLSFLIYRQGARAFAWMNKTRITDDNAKDLDDVAAHLKEAVDKLCEFAQKPCRAEDFTPLRKLRNLIHTSAEQLDMIRPELETVVQRFDTYLGKALTLPAASSGSRVAQMQQAMENAMERAMEQEHARIQLHSAVNTAQQKIRALRKA
ncbi:hypothetical protein [Streptomyces sp. NPDC054794]